MRWMAWYRLHHQLQLRMACDNTEWSKNIWFMLPQATVLTFYCCPNEHMKEQAVSWHKRKLIHHIHHLHIHQNVDKWSRDKIQLQYSSGTKFWNVMLLHQWGSQKAQHLSSKIYGIMGSRRENFKETFAHGFVSVFTPLSALPSLDS